MALAVSSSLARIMPIKVIKFTDNKGMIIEIFENSSLAGKNTSTLVAMQSMKAQAMAKVLVEEGIDN